jgi:hypothetical protein
VFQNKRKSTLPFGGEISRLGSDLDGLGDLTSQNSAVLDDAPGMGLRAGKQIRSARGTARTSPWCAVKHREIDWGVPLLLTGEFELEIMIEVVIEEMHGSD